ncbi:MAG: hypothetical protein A3F11_06910 [Gammaproteobacteria bacterium RIFCSPHIGHO2_12_FULL_37_14]|nr:MAG: hypothetical protein A3F11_06910 [Gammaproteobacteria bacterium RIFCSPHIGHO2_12_FULL_37_14]
MANRNISEKPIQSQFLNDQISASERLSICSFNCDSPKHPVTRYRSERKNRKAFRQFFYSSKTVLG